MARRIKGGIKRRETDPASNQFPKRSNQSILKEISPGISLEGMMLKLKLQYFGHLMRRVVRVLAKFPLH